MFMVLNFRVIMILEQLKDFIRHGKKNIRMIWRIDKKTHNLLIHAINNCLPISLLLEKRCIQFIWNLFNSPYAVHKSVITCSYYNIGSTISENIRCFMYKYDINMYD